MSSENVCSLSGVDIHTFERGAEFCRCGSRSFLNRPRPLRTVIAINLNHLRDLMDEYVKTSQVGQLNPTTTELLFSNFLAWLRRRMEERDGPAT